MSRPGERKAERPGATLMRSIVRREWKPLAAAGASTVLVTAAELARPWPLAIVINELIEHHANGPFELGAHDTRVLAFAAGAVLLIALVDAAATYQSEVRLGRAGERILHRLRVRVYDHLQRLSLPYHERRQTGDLVTRVTGDVNAVGDLFAQSLGRIVSAGLLLVGMLVVSVALDPVLALAAFATVPLLFVLTWTFRRRVKKLSRRQRDKEGEIASIASEALAAMPVVKAHGSEGRERDRVEQHSRERRRLGVKAVRLESRFAGVVDLLGAVGAAVVIVVGVLRVAAGALEPGDLIVFSSYTRRAYRPLRDIAREAGRVARAMARVDRIAEVLGADQVLPERPHAYAGDRAKGAIGLEGATFAYGLDRPALEDVTLRIPAGSRVAAVGRSGAGKSTLLALIARFYDPAAGRVKLDGRDLRDCSLDWLRAQVGLVLQDSVLFSGTVAENIAYGTDAARDEVVQAAKTAGADGFIAELPDGYDTDLGRAGVALSGGQRQRIAIARTILRDPSVLLLDEPTRGLDPESESHVLEGLERLMQARTTILVTHSLALARDADYVAVVDGGRVVQWGKPSELFDEHGLVRHLASQQGLVERARPEVPRDPALPQLRRLLDADAMAPVLQRSLRPGAPFPDVRVRYLRYKPATNLVVHYEVTVDGQRHDASATIAAEASMAKRARRSENVELAAKLDGRSPAASPLHYDADIGALIQWLPLDVSLPATAAPPEELACELTARGVELSGEEPEWLSYRPRRRAVLRIGRHVLKIYAREDDFRTALAGLAVSSAAGLDAPGYEAAVPEWRLTAQTAIGGERAAPGGQTARHAGALLRRIHAVDAPAVAVATPSRQLEAAGRSAELAATLVPGLRPRIDRLMARLADSRPEPGALVASHGDFHAGQLLQANGTLVAIDYDEMCRAPAAFDVANYAAHLVRGNAGEVAAALATLEHLADGYGSRPPALGWYFATCVLRRAPFPFRCLAEDWPARVEALVAAAEGPAP